MTDFPETARARPVVDWPAIWAGAAIASAAAIVFTGFTTAIGLGSVSAEQGEGLGWFAAVLVGLFAFVTTLAAYGLGGYIAGRMRPAVTGIGADELRARDGVHGLAVWAIGTLLSAILSLGLLSGGVKAVGNVASTAVEAGGSAVGGALQGVGQVAGGVVSGAGQVAGGVVSGAGQLAGGALQGAGEAANSDTLEDMLPGDAQSNPVDYFTDRLLRPEAAAPSQFSNEALQRELVGILGNVLRTGELSDADRDYMVQAVAARTQATPAEVEARVDEVVTEVQNIRAEAEQRLEDARAKAEQAVADARAKAEEVQAEAQRRLDEAQQAAIDAAEKARSTAVWAAFILAATSLIAGVVAFLSAIRGGRDRDAGRVWGGLHRGLRRD